MRAVFMALGLLLFAPLLEAEVSDSPPCAGEAVYRQLDFWFGDWQV